MSFWVAGAIVAGGAVVSSVVSSNAAKSAAKSQAASTDSANQLQWDMYDTTRQDNMPALQARNASLVKMQELLGIGGDSGAAGYGSASGKINVGDVTADPGYQFGLQQGQNALSRQAAARGMYNSGAALKAATRYGNDYGSTKYNDSYNRLQSERTNNFNRLASVAGLGQTGANLLGSAGANTANQIGNNLTSLGNAQGASQLSSANAWNNNLNQSAGWFANRLSNTSTNPLSGGYTASSQQAYSSPAWDAWAGGTGGMGD